MVPLGEAGRAHIWRMPNVVILAGPNGAGKTSAAPVLLRDAYQVTEFVNADVIARGLSGFSADAVAVEAGRIMLRRLDELANAKQDFAFETTLSGNAFLGAIDRWRSAGYVIRIVYLWLESPEIAIARVRRRVRQGGHSVPDEVIRRRYHRGTVNFANRYREAADEWQLYDNTNPLDRRPVARGVRSAIEVVDAERWARFERAVGSVPRIREVLVADRPPIPDDHLARCFRDTTVLERAMRITHARVIRRHRLLNEPLVTWRDGQVVELDPHSVPMPDDVTEEQMGPVFDYL
jgi:predicted ABC-type ATPase